jgi:hypothetical protein
MTVGIISVTAIGLAVFAVPALAHHSFAMFDAEKTIELQGTVKEFQWTNPHSWLEVVVERDGKASTWALEMSSPSTLARDGWKPKTVVQGDKVTVTMHPMKDGSPAGQFISIKLPNGKVLGEG